MSDPLNNPGGRVNFDTNERIVSADFDNVGNIALQSLTGFLAMLMRDSLFDVPFSGFVGPSDCLVSLSSAPLTIQVAKGIGFYYDSAESGAFSAHYKPIIVPSAFTHELGAHDATNPRIDIVCLAPSTTDDQPSSRLVLNTGTTSINKRTRLSYDYTVVAGTPAATPSAPAVPSGYVKIAECRVPATSGSAVITDHRPRLVLGQAFTEADYISDSYVPGSGAELQVSATSPAAMAVDVASGECVIVATSGVRRRRYGNQRLTVTAADPTNPRIDIVVAKPDGTLAVTAGTPAGSPVAPSPSTGEEVLAQIAVAAAAASIVGANITDMRTREPVGSSKIRDSAVTTAKIADAGVTPAKLSKMHVVPSISDPSGGGSSPTVQIGTRDVDGAVVARAQLYRVEVYSAGAGVFTIAITAGTAVISGTNPAFVRSLSDGTCEIDIQGDPLLAGQEHVLIVTPLSEDGDTAEPGMPRARTWSF
jgi:hypothetical protein